MFIPILLATIIGAPPAEQRGPLVQSVASVAMTVSDLDRSIDFFTRTLDFKLESRAERRGEHVERTFGVQGAHVRSALLRLGEERIEIIDFVSAGGRPIPVDSASNDRWFQHIAIVVSDMDAAVARLRGAKVKEISAGPQRLPDWNVNAGGIEALYFEDPDRHVLEIIHFPDAKGDPRWHASATPCDGAGSTAGLPAPIFLGIDHTAIVTADTDRDLAFYTGVLGMHAAGTSNNYGIEQERLNNVFGAHLRITTLRAASGPGIELLEYLTPTNGRDYPRDSRPNDLWHWHVTLITGPGWEPALARARAPRISAAPAAPGRPLAAVMVRDPDGHALLIQPGLEQSLPGACGSAIER